MKVLEILGVVRKGPFAKQQDTETYLTISQAVFDADVREELIRKNNVMKAGYVRRALRFKEKTIFHLCGMEVWQFIELWREVQTH